MFKVTVKGLPGVKAQFASATKDIVDIVDQELESMAKEWVAGAKRDAPVDQGTLKAGISYLINDRRVEIFSNVFYSPFMEFGTKGKYLPIPGTENIAAQFKGYKGGDFGEMLKFIELWVAKKGITGTYSVKTRRRTGGKALIASQNKQTAFAIAISILKNGVSPHPYFFKQKDTVWPEMVRKVQKRIEQGSRITVIMPGDINRPRIVTI